MRPLIGVTTDIGDGLFRLKEPYIAALEHFGLDPVIIPPTADPSGLLPHLAGVVFTGGADLDPAYYGERILFEVKLVDRRRSEFELPLVKTCLERDLPVLAICFGMQMMNVALGGTLLQDIGGQHSTAVDHRTGFHEIALSSAGFIGDGRYRVNSSHHQAVRAPGRGLSVSGRSDDGVIEALIEPSRRFCVGVQWHPERDIDAPVNMHLFESFREACRRGSPE